MNGITEVSTGVSPYITLGESLVTRPSVSFVGEPVVDESPNSVEESVVAGSSNLLFEEPMVAGPSSHLIEELAVAGPSNRSIEEPVVAGTSNRSSEESTAVRNAEISTVFEKEPIAPHISLSMVEGFSREDIREGVFILLITCAVMIINFLITNLTVAETILAELKKNTMIYTDEEARRNPSAYGNCISVERDNFVDYCTMFAKDPFFQ